MSKAKVVSAALGAEADSMIFRLFFLDAAGKVVDVQKCSPNILMKIIESMDMDYRKLLKSKKRLGIIFGVTTGALLYRNYKLKKKLERKESGWIQ